VVEQEVVHLHARLGRVRTLEVAVFDDGDGRGHGTTDVVALGVDVGVQVGERFGPAEERAPAQPGREMRGDTEEQPVATSPALRTPSFASSRWSPRKASVAIRSETVKPMPATVPAPPTAAQPTGGRSRPRVARVGSQVPLRMPIGLTAT